jgi:hypothetical protein
VDLAVAVAAASGSGGGGGGRGRSGGSRRRPRVDPVVFFFIRVCFFFVESDIGIKFMSSTRIKIALLCCFWLSHCLIHLGSNWGIFFEGIGLESYECFWLSHCLIYLGIKMGDFFEGIGLDSYEGRRTKRMVFFEQKSRVKRR